jgi:Xaa-Pro aminopeptidase
MRPIVALLCLVAAPLAAQGPVPELPGAALPVDVEAHRARRAQLAERLGNGVVLVPAAERRDPEKDVLQDGDFRQDDYFFYLTGIETPGAWLMLVARQGSVGTVTLFLQPRNPFVERWMGVQLGPGEDAVRLTGIEQVLAWHPDSLKRAVRGAEARGGVPFYAVMYPGTSGDDQILEWLMTDREVRNVVPVMDSLRVVKDEVSLAALRRAIAITTEGIKAGMRTAQPGMHEYQLEALIEYTFRDLGADRLGFPSIVGSGPNSVILHYDLSRRQMQAGDLVVVDVGAEYAQHTADVTRTFPVSGAFTDRQKAIYDLVLETQDAIIGAVKPGVTVRDLNRIARAHLRDHSGDRCGEPDCSRYLVHGISHWLGMRVHDVGDYGMPLEPGLVLTIEPGIYLPDENLGVRIEDDLLVTETGAEVLSAGAPRTTVDIERLMQTAEQRQATGSD